MTWQLRPGVGLARRDAGHVQVGVSPHAAVLPDTRRVRLLLIELAHGAPLSTLDETTAPVLDELVRHGVVEPVREVMARRTARERCAVHLDVPARLLPAAKKLAGEAGLSVSERPEAATVALVWAEGELARGRLDGWMRTGTPHLVVSEGPAGPTLGPYVVPGASACQRCVDAHLGEVDPRHPLVVEQLATGTPLRAAEPDPALRALALGWAVRDLAVAAEGGVPSTWSATVSLASLPPVVTGFRRHPYCGCAWGDFAAEQDRAARAG